MSHLPLVLGHAGAGVSGPTPENSLAGAAQSLREGADGIEIDVQLSADGEPVLMHDATVARMTGAHGRVRALTLAQLQQARLANGEAVPTLSALLQQVAGRMTVMCELKVDRDDPVEAAGKGELVAAVLRVIAAHDAHTWTAIHSFDGDVVAAARLAEPRVSAALIVPNQDEAGMQRMLGALLRRHAQAISVQHACITPELVRMAKRRQVTLWCWSPNRETDWARLLDAGVDGIMTDHPAALRAFIAGRG
jgi:glycerophosphoryl diester phosphodiesterase